MSRPESGPARLVAAFRHLGREQRTVVLAALVLLGTMLLPWYSLDAFAPGGGQVAKTSTSKLAITVFSFVEAAIFLVAVGVTLLVLARGDRRAFHLPGGDGAVVTAAGAWATFLIFYRFVDKPGSEFGGGTVRLEYGLSWGIFFGLLAALGLVVAGLRLRAARIAEPPLPGSVDPSDAPTAVATPRREPRPSRAVAASGDEDSRAARRREREARRGGRALPGPQHDAATRVARDPAPARTPDGDPAPARDEAPTRVEPAPRPFGEPPSFEPPEYEPPPR